MFFWGWFQSLDGSLLWGFRLGFFFLIVIFQQWYTCLSPRLQHHQHGITFKISQIIISGRKKGRTPKIIKNIAFKKTKPNQPRKKYTKQKDVGDPLHFGMEMSFHFYLYPVRADQAFLNFEISPCFFILAIKECFKKIFGENISTHSNNSWTSFQKQANQGQQRCSSCSSCT